jgi:hypothetical protein
MVKNSVKLNISDERGSGTIYIKKEFMQKIKLPPNVDLEAEYNEETGVLCIREWK